MYFADDHILVKVFETGVRKIAQWVGAHTFHGEDSDSVSSNAWSPKYCQEWPLSTELKVVSSTIGYGSRT